MSKRFALFDFDNTLYDGHSLMEIIDAQLAAGFIDRSLNEDLKRILAEHEAGRLAYEDMARQALERYAEGLAGKSYEQAFQIALTHFRQTDRIFSFARPVIDLLNDTHQIALVTALPEPGAKAAAAVIGATEVYCTRYGVRDGTFDGTVVESLGSRQGKHACVQHIEHEHSMANSFVFGDSEGDIEMLAAATHAICINPSDGLRSVAQRNGWHICQPDEVLRVVETLLAKP